MLRLKDDVAAYCLDEAALYYLARVERGDELKGDPPPGNAALLRRLGAE